MIHGVARENHKRLLRAQAQFHQGRRQMADPVPGLGKCHALPAITGPFGDHQPVRRGVGPVIQTGIGGAEPVRPGRGIHQQQRSIVPVVDPQTPGRVTRVAIGCIQSCLAVHECPPLCWPPV